jgi:hypothetical protein
MYDDDDDNDIDDDDNNGDGENDDDDDDDLCVDIFFMMNGLKIYYGDVDDEGGDHCDDFDYYSYNYVFIDQL